jgi:hypothetical protein
MVSINLYQSGSFDIQIEFPSCWDDLDHNEVIEICKLQLINPTNQGDNRVAFFFFIIQNRCNKKGQLLTRDWQSKMDLEVVAQSLFLLDFIYTQNNLTLQPHKTLNVGGKLLIGLESDFENITCGEFECLELLFHEFTASPSAALLAKMSAIIFREQGVAFQQIVNEKIVTYDFDTKSIPFMELKPWILYSIYTWYCGCRLNLPNKFPTVYEGNGEETEPDSLAFTKCIHSGAGVKNGTRNQIRITLLLEYMFEMEQEAIKVKELNAQQNG